jgi:molybdenum cofactor biosynthesis protein B
MDLIRRGKHRVAGYRIVRDEPARIRAAIRKALADRDVFSVFISGGTGLSRRDRTSHAVRGLYEQEIPGFGEIFRLLSFEEIGSRAMTSRASAGLMREKPVFSVPGSPAAARLALTRLVLPELPHIRHELIKHKKSQAGEGMLR